MVKRSVLMLLLILILAGCISGCFNASPEQPITEAPIPETQLTLPSLPEFEDIVIPAISKTYEWDDGVGNRNRVTIRLPHIDYSRKCAAAFNADIDSFANEIITEVEDCAEGAYSTHITSVNYEAYLNDDVLSILITSGFSTDYVEYIVHNFDLEDDEAMSTADMCAEFLDMDYPVFLKYTFDRIWAEFEEKHADFITQNREEHEFVYNLYASDVSVLCRYGLYLNEDNRLILIADHPSVAGAAYYPKLQEAHIDSTIVPRDSDSWNWLFDLYLGADPDMIEYARELLITAFEDNQKDFMQYLRTRSQEEREVLETAIRVKYNSKG